MATGLDIDREPIKEPMHSIMPLLLDQHMSNYDKMRVIILYIISKNGVSEENLNKVIRHGQLSPEEKQAIINLSHIGLNAVLSVGILAVFSSGFFFFFFQISFKRVLLQFQGDRKKMNDYPRKKREGAHRYDVSRWVPIVKDIMEDCIENNLDRKHFPYLFDRTASSGGYVAMNSRYRTRIIV